MYFCCCGNPNLTADGDFDCFIGRAFPDRTGATVEFWANLGNRTHPHFEQQKGLDSRGRAKNPLGDVSMLFAAPSCANLGSGLIDCMVSSSQEAVHFYKNVGTTTTPMLVRQPRTNVTTYPFVNIDESELKGSFNCIPLVNESMRVCFVGNSGGSTRYLMGDMLQEATGNAQHFVANGENPLGFVDVGYDAAPEVPYLYLHLRTPPKLTPTPLPSSVL